MDMQDAILTRSEELEASLEAALADNARLSEQVETLRTIAQRALDGAGDAQIVYAPLLLQALEDIVSEEA